MNQLTPNLLIVASVSSGSFSPSGLPHPSVSQGYVGLLVPPRFGMFPPRFFFFFSFPHPQWLNTLYGFLVDVLGWGNAKDPPSPFFFTLRGRLLPLAGDWSIPTGFPLALDHSIPCCFPFPNGLSLRIGRCFLSPPFFTIGPPNRGTFFSVLKLFLFPLA